jgi:hypothetical protein
MRRFSREWICDTRLPDTSSTSPDLPQREVLDVEQHGDLAFAGRQALERPPELGAGLLARGLTLRVELGVVGLDRSISSRLPSTPVTASEDSEVRSDLLISYSSLSVAPSRGVGARRGRPRGCALDERHIREHEPVAQR